MKVIFMNTQISPNIDDTEIDIKTFVFSIYQYKFMIALIVIVFGLASAYYAYFLPDVYRATASVKVGLDQDEYAKDVISMAMGKGAVNAATEKDLIKSRYLATEALKNVDFTHHYYVKKDYKEVEVTQDSPIFVDMERGYGISFQVKMIDDIQFRLLVDEQVDSNGKKWQYNHIHRYGEKINTEHFHLTVQKHNLKNLKQCRFVVDKTRQKFGHILVSQHLENSTILQISVEDTVAIRAKQYANALAESYVKLNVENKTREAIQRLSFINKQLETVEKNIKHSANQLEEFRKKSKIVDVEHISETIATRLDSYESDLMELQAKEKMLKSFYEQVKKGTNIETLSIEGIENKESILADLMGKLQEVVVKKKELRQDYTNLHPLVQKTNRKISQLKSTIVNTAANLVKNVENRKILLLESIKKQRKILNTLPANERTYKQLESKFKMNEEIHSYLLKRKAETEMVRASTVSKNRMLDRAQLPTTPIKPQRKSIVLIGLFFGFIVGIMIAFLRVFLDTKIKDENDMRKIIDYPILGTIPHFSEPKQHKESIMVFDEVKSILAESFRHLRSNLQFLRKEEGSEVILLTSTIGEEGKTTVAVNLAAIFSLSSKKTIVINLDMRKPTLHKKFGLANKIGLSEVLNNRVELKDVIQQTSYTDLDILSSGAIPPNPSELIQSDTMYSVLESLKKSYDIIILDTPPIGLVTDAKELMHYVDINIYVVRSNYSQKEFLENLKKYDFLKNVNCIGLLLNDIKIKKGHYGYYSGYGYYET